MLPIVLITVPLIGAEPPLLIGSATQAGFEIAVIWDGSLMHEALSCARHGQEEFFLSSDSLNRPGAASPKGIRVAD